MSDIDLNTTDLYALDYTEKTRMLELTVVEIVKMKQEISDKSEAYFKAKAEFDTMKKRFEYLKELKSGLQSAIKAEQAM